jgi:hypothetical protein
MSDPSYLEHYLANLIHAEGKRFAWWPWQTTSSWEEHVQRRPMRLHGKRDLIAVGMNCDGCLMVQEIDGIEELSQMSTDVFVLSYRVINERFRHENDG